MGRPLARNKDGTASLRSLLPSRERDIPRLEQRLKRGRAGAVDGSLEARVDLHLRRHRARGVPRRVEQRGARRRALEPCGTQGLVAAARRVELCLHVAQQPHLQREGVPARERRELTVWQGCGLGSGSGARRGRRRVGQARGEFLAQIPKQAELQRVNLQFEWRRHLNLHRRLHPVRRGQR